MHHCSKTLDKMAKLSPQVGFQDSGNEPFICRLKVGGQLQLRLKGCVGDPWCVDSSNIWESVLLPRVLVWVVCLICPSIDYKLVHFRNTVIKRASVCFDAFCTMESVIGQLLILLTVLWPLGTFLCVCVEISVVSLTTNEHHGEVGQGSIDEWTIAVDGFTKSNTQLHFKNTLVIFNNNHLTPPFMGLEVNVPRTSTKHSFSHILNSKESIVLMKLFTAVLLGFSVNTVRYIQSVLNIQFRWIPAITIYKHWWIEQLWIESLSRTLEAGGCLLDEIV